MKLIEDALDVPNTAFHKEWLPSIATDINNGGKISKGRDTAPSVIDEQILKSQCQKHLHEIGAGINTFLPNVKVRYVIEKDNFGYAYFGNFFFYGDDFYVWEKDDKYAEDHNQDIVQTVFGDECEGRGYACRVIFAGVQTEFKDCNGERIFTGDVIKVEKNEYSTHIFAVGAYVNDDGSGDYCFFLDNHYWSLADFYHQHFKTTRIGTVFYQLDASDYISVNQRTIGFNEWRDTEEDMRQKTLMAKYTPNFDKEFWKYGGLEILGAEFNWR